MDARWRCFPLHPEVPAEGMSLALLFKRSESEIETWAKNFRQTASQIGLPFGPWQKIFNTRLAQELGLWAAERGRGEKFHMAAFQAYFVDERNIARKDVLLELAEAVGLSRDEADGVMEKRVFKDAADKDWAAARTLNITAVPTLVLGENRLVGAQPYEQMLRFVEQSR
jgi:predicted DsbA family dithiol-disulfide isomerase